VSRHNRTTGCSPVTQTRRSAIGYEHVANAAIPSDDTTCTNICLPWPQADCMRSHRCNIIIASIWSLSYDPLCIEGIASTHTSCPYNVWTRALILSRQVPVRPFVRLALSYSSSSTNHTIWVCLSLRSILRNTRSSRRRRVESGASVYIVCLELSHRLTWFRVHFRSGIDVLEAGRPIGEVRLRGGE
jgi:hypothetical protein